MSEELSRVKSRRKQSNDDSQPSASRRKNKPSAGSAAPQDEQRIPAPGTLSRKARYSATSPKQERKQKGAAQEAEETPSRAQSYPSERIRLSKIFVNSLIVMFVLLLASLFWWGIEGAPELRELW